MLNTYDDHALICEADELDGKCEATNALLEETVKFYDRGNFVNSDRVSLLRKRCEENDVKLVGISSWFAYRAQKDEFAEFFNLPLIDIVDNTSGGMGRVDSTAKWLAEHKPESFVILDDQMVGWRDLYKEHHVELRNGLGPFELQQLKELLDKQAT